MATWSTSGNTMYADPTSIDVAIGGTDSNASFWFDVDTKATFNKKLEAKANIDLIQSFLEQAGKITFKSTDTPPTARTSMFEKDGDFYLAVNATFDGSDWNRVVTDKYAYLMVVWSKHNVDEGDQYNPPSGPMWYRAEPHANPIAGWQAQYGWETGLFMTQDRNLVLGGVNLEVDGSGLKPHGRFTHIAHNDASGQPRTLIQQAAWYNTGDSWERDLHPRNSAQNCTMNGSTNIVSCTGHGLIVGDAITFTGTTGGVSTTTTYYILTVPNVDSFTFSTTRGGSTFDITADGSNQVRAWVDSSALVTDLYGNWEFWFRDALASSPWNTAAWERIARLHVNDGIAKGRLDVFRQTTETNAARSSFLAKHKTTGDMVDVFGAGYAWAIEDNAGVENIIGAMYAMRNGADNTGRFSWQLPSAGTMAERMSLTAAGKLRIYGDITNEDYFELTSTRDAWSGGSLTSEIRLGAFCVSGNWPVVYFNGHYNSGDKYTISDNAFQIVHNLNTKLLNLRTAPAGIAENAIGYHIAISLGDSGSASKVGFFGATPVVQQTHVTDADGTLAGATTAINAVISKLEALGLFASS